MPDEGEVIEVLWPGEGAFVLTEQEARVLVRYFDANGRTLPAMGPVGSGAIHRLREALDAS